MGKGGRVHTADPLRIERGVTIIRFGDTNYACKIAGTGRSEQITVLGKLTTSLPDMNAASLAARRACERGTKAFVSVSESVHLAEEVPNAANVAAQIAQHRVNQRTGDFSRHKF